MSRLEERRRRLREARLYFVTEPVDPELLDAALHGGVGILQLRDKEASDAEVVAAAPVFRELCDRHGALFVVNDRADLALAAGADGVHVGQDDPFPDERGDLLVGLSTHSPEQFDAGLETDVDYLCAGPVHETPTKAGRAATGVGLVRHAAEHAGERPWFAIGGIDQSNVASVVEAGARRAVVVRAIRDAGDPRAAAESLRAELSRTSGMGSDPLSAPLSRRQTP